MHINWSRRIPWKRSCPLFSLTFQYIKAASVFSLTFFFLLLFGSGVCTDHCYYWLSLFFISSTLFGIVPHRGYSGSWNFFDLIFWHNWKEYRKKITKKCIPSCYAKIWGQTKFQLPEYPRCGCKALYIEKEERERD